MTFEKNCNCSCVGAAAACCSESGLAEDRRAVWKDTRTPCYRSLDTYSPPPQRRRRHDAPKTNPNYHSSSYSEAVKTEEINRALARTRDPGKTARVQPNTSYDSAVRPTSGWQPQASSVQPTSGWQPQANGIWYSRSSDTAQPGAAGQQWRTAEAQPSAVGQQWRTAEAQPGAAGPQWRTAEAQPGTVGQQWRTAHRNSYTLAKDSPISRRQPAQPTISGIQPHSVAAGQYESVQCPATPQHRPSTPRHHHVHCPHSRRPSTLSRSKSLPGSPHATPARKPAPTQPLPALPRTTSFPESPSKQRRRVFRGNAYSVVNKSEPFIFEKETVL